MPEPNPKLQTVIHPWRCKHCHTDFPHMHIVTVAEIDSLMIGGNRIAKMEFPCYKCGTWNYWNIREKEITEQTEIFLVLLAELHGSPIEPEK